MIDRRTAVKSMSLGAASIAVGGAGMTSEARGAGSGKPVFVLVHGAWHGAWTWSDLVPELAKAGYASVALDLPGAGTRTLLPKSFQKRPLDMAAFSTEMSPVAAITQDERTSATIDVVKCAASMGNGRVVLVGHSWGGLTISRVAEAVPELLQSVVYLSAFLLPNGVPAGALLGDAAFSTSLVNPMMKADPQKVGALRMDTRTDDPAGRAAMKRAFYGDISDERFDVIANFLHPDEVASTAGVPMAITGSRYGTVQRHYIAMDADNAIPPVAQDMMVKVVDESKIGGSTSVHRMSGSHSPFFAKPGELAQVLGSVAG